MNTIVSQLPNMELKEKKILMRADLNVPINNGSIEHTHRLEAIKPTLDLILEKKGIIFLASHLGKPKNQEPELSTKQLIPWFKKQGYTIRFAPTLADAQQLGNTQEPQIILLENLRFFSGEKERSEKFAYQLAELADIFVQDAFGTLHRKDASIVLVPTLFSPNSRTIGLLVQEELSHLNKLIEPKHPFTMIAGGGKIADKLTYALELLDTWDTLLPCPALVFPLLEAQNKPIGASLSDQEAIPVAKKLLKQAKEKDKPILFPTDYLVETHNGDLKNVTQLTNDDKGISIGTQTIDAYKKAILSAKTVFYAGLMGFLEQPKTLEAVKELFKAMAQSDSYSVIGGGDSVAAAQQLNIQNIDWLSTGGGATLAYITGHQLPGLQPFIT